MTEASTSTTGTEASASVWFKSSYSGGEGNECVEVAHVRTRVGIRDSKEPHRNGLTISAAAFTAFVGGVKAAE
ncbi:DUF397 domain-containing protein [Streptomyces sp. NPDC093510]|uniref:DUF397 domain-containing protein n=1 Tax=Streptomyces sp. NPDC093510 TaxID=3155199 RepID=UPI00343BA762